jgi:hypothetical protein
VTWYPGWDSLDSVRNWHTIFEISGIAFLALLVGAEILAFQYGHRKDELVAVAEHAAETRREQSEATTKAQQKLVKKRPPLNRPLPHVILRKVNEAQFPMPLRHFLARPSI